MAVLRGFETVSEALDAEDFPMDKQAIAYSVGDIEVEGRGGALVPVRVLLERIPRDEFLDANAVVRALRAAARA